MCGALFSGLSIESRRGHASTDLVSGRHRRNRGVAERCLTSGAPILARSEAPRTRSVAHERFGTLRRNFPDCPEEGIDVEMPEGATSEELFARLKIAPKRGIVYADGAILRPYAPLPQDVSVSIFQPATGG